MVEIKDKQPIIIVGPTAGGKSELAVAIATRLGTGCSQIINADSMQIYRGMDAGTAKPSVKMRQQVPHHLIDIVEPTERFTVFDWLTRAEKIIDDLIAQGIWPIVVGGTNLYIKALLEGLFEGPALDPDFRAKLEGIDHDKLHEDLKAVDPEAANRIHRNDRKKIVRALEVHHTTGKPISQMQLQWSERQDTGGFIERTDSNDSEQPQLYRRNPILFGLDWPTDQINKRINQRVKRMFHPGAIDLDDTNELVATKDEKLINKHGLVNEVQRLIAEKMFGLQSSQAIGYKQVIDYIRGDCSIEEAFEKTKIVTRRFAKNQRTWLRRFRGVHWFSPVSESIDDIAGNAVKIIMSI